jgi:hypothetical protein
MALCKEFVPVNTDEEIKQSLWDDFVNYYNMVGQGGYLIKYNDKDFRLKGIPSPRQVIAWRELIKIIGEDNFNRLPFELNYLDNHEILFTEKLNNFLNDPTNIEITFSCGYFFKYSEERRKKMVIFVINDMLKKGITVNIWTKDHTLKREFKEKLDSAHSHNLNIYYGRHRIDIHYTLIENKNHFNKSAVFLELPHTEAHDFRLETYFTFEDINSFGCDSKKILRFLEKQRKWNVIKSTLSLCNRALNMK